MTNVKGHNNKRAPVLQGPLDGEKWQHLRPQTHKFGILARFSTDMHVQKCITPALPEGENRSK